MSSGFVDTKSISILDTQHFTMESANYTHFHCEIYFHWYNILILSINQFHTSSGKNTTCSQSKLKSYTHGTRLFSIVVNLHMCAYIFYLLYILIVFMKCIPCYLCSHFLLDTICFFYLQLFGIFYLLSNSSITFLIPNLFAVIFSYSCFLSSPLMPLFDE